MIVAEGIEGGNGLAERACGKLWMTAMRTRSLSLQ